MSSGSSEVEVFTVPSFVGKKYTDLASNQAYTKMCIRDSGRAARCSGKNAPDLIIRVPRGTLVRDAPVSYTHLISVLIAKADADRAVNAIHDAFLN